MCKVPPDGMRRLIKRRMPSGGTLHIEDIQDQVELELMRAGEHKIARDYVIYREARRQERDAKVELSAETQAAAAAWVSADNSTLASRS